MKTMQELWVSAGLAVQDGKDEREVVREMLKLRESTLNESGCIQFDIRRHQKESNKFTLWEGWTSDEALQQHYDAPHTQAYFAKEYTKVEYIEFLAPNLEAQ